MKQPETQSEKSADLLQQKYLGRKGLIIFIVLMNMFVPLTTDLYLPALPTMVEYFGSSSAVTNITLSAFFICYAAGILAFGPMSDKYGRRPIILIGSILFIISSAACALSPNITLLIIARIVQGIGSGGITASSIAMVKDSFTGKKRESVLAIAQTLTGLAPMVAPAIGAVILQFINWQGIFWALALAGIGNLILTFLYQESLKEEDRFTGTVTGSIGRLAYVAKNKSFMVPAVILSLNAIPFMGYIAVSSYIYINYFGFSAQIYSYFFAVNALVSTMGPPLYIKYLRNSNKKIFIGVCLGIGAVSGIVMLTAGRLSPILFLTAMAAMSITFTSTRPYSTNLLLEQQKGDTGSASSLINTAWTVLGSAGMVLASMPWGNLVFGLGLIMAAVSFVSLLSWVGFIRSEIPCKGLKD